MFGKELFESYKDGDGKEKMIAADLVQFIASADSAQLNGMGKSEAESLVKDFCAIVLMQ